MHYDVFNGDADGICALHQLRLAVPRESELISGVKRDIKLLQRLSGIEDSTITVLDISLDTNRASLLELLCRRNKILYFDHHFAGEIPRSPGLDVFIDTAPNVCTSLLVDRYLQGHYRTWAIAAAFGDNLHTPACELSASLALAEFQVRQLCELGELINYNSYGDEIKDLNYSPIALYQALKPFEDPWEFYHQSEVVSVLKYSYVDDLEKARSHTPIKQCEAGFIYQFPAQSWSKRIAGVFCNIIAREEPEKAHALLVDRGDGNFLVSVRAPMNRPIGADRLCHDFHSGGGRKAAAGINKLPDAKVDCFLEQFESVFTHHP